MDDMLLVQPDESMLDEINAYRRAMLEACSSMDGTGSLCRHEAEEWLAWSRSVLTEATCPPHLVPATQYVYVRKADARIVGMIQLRHRFNDYLAEFGGHIGYSVRPDERRKGYAKQMLALVLKEAKMLGLSRVLVTCDDDNAASARTIQANGGVFERTAWLESEGVTLRRYWIEL